MKRFAQLLLILMLPLMLSACLYGRCFDGPCVLERERILNNMKSLGEQWSKPGMTKESWRQDWVACGGTPNGSYANDAPRNASDLEAMANGKKIRQKLAFCMAAKGYLRDYDPGADE